MTRKKTIYCKWCAGEITSKDDLVITNKLFSIVLYHEKCFSKELKGLSTISVGNKPINGTAGNASIIISFM